MLILIEVYKYNTEITREVDHHVFDIVQKHFPNLMNIYNDSRIELIITFLNKFDILIIDTTDPDTLDFYLTILALLNKKMIINKNVLFVSGADYMNQLLNRVKKILINKNNHLRPIYDDGHTVFIISFDDIDL